MKEKVPDKGKKSARIIQFKPTSAGEQPVILPGPTAKIIPFPNSGSDGSDSLRVEYMYEVAPGFVDGGFDVLYKQYREAFARFKQVFDEAQSHFQLDNRVQILYHRQELLQFSIERALKEYTVINRFVLRMKRRYVLKQIKIMDAEAQSLRDAIRKHTEKE